MSAGKTFQDTLGLSSNHAIIVGAAIVFVYTVTGGFWAVSVSDVIQGLMMVLASIIVPVAALMAVGGVGALWTKLSVQSPSYLSFTAGKSGVECVVFVVGLLAIVLGAMGQLHVVNRFMALRSGKDIKLGACWSMFGSWRILFFGQFLRKIQGKLRAWPHKKYDP